MGRPRAEILCKAGYSSLWKVKRTSADELSSIPGIGPETAKNIKSATNLILLLPRRRSKEETFEDVRACQKCGLPAPVFVEKCAECGSTFESEDLDEALRKELDGQGVNAVIEFYGQMLCNITDDALLWYALALSLSAAGRVDASRKALAKAKKLEPENTRFANLELRLERREPIPIPPAKEPEAQPPKRVGKPKEAVPPEKSVPKEIQIEQPKESERLCPTCGKPIPPESEACPSCAAEKMEEKKPEAGMIESLEQLKGLAEIDAALDGMGSIEEPAATEPPGVEPATTEETAEVEEAAHKMEIVSATKASKPALVSVMSGRRPLLTGYGLVNGRGRVNGLINGNGFVNGGSISDVRLPRNNLFHRYAAIATFLMAVFLIVNTAMHVPVESRKAIQIDGSFADWQPVGKFHDATRSSNPDTNLTSYSLVLEGSTLFFMADVEGSLFADNQGIDSFYLFLDADGDNSTGYSCGAIGAEYMVAVEGFNSSVSSTSLEAFTGQDRLDWNHWSGIGGATVAVSGGRLEGMIETTGLTISYGGRLLARFAVDDQEGGMSLSTILIGPSHSALKVTQKGLTEVLSTRVGDFIELTFEVTGPPVTLHAADITISHTSGAQINGLPDPLILSEGNPRTVVVTLDASVIATGEVVEASLQSIRADRPVTIIGNPAKAYVLSPPAGKRIDGLFADWPAPRLDTDSQPPSDPEVDIDAHDGNVTGDTAFFYLRTVEQAFRGSATPERKQRLFSPPSSGGGVSHPPPRLTGETFARAYVDTDASDQNGYPVGGLRAKYMIEARGQFGALHSISTYRWEGRWVIFSGGPRIASAGREVEMSISLPGVDLANTSYVIETRNWRGIGDETAVSGTRGGEDSRTRGLVVVILGTSTHLYALPTTTPPTIDGDWSSTEWQDADSYDTGDIIVYTMQNGTHLYLCIRVRSDTVYNAGDYAEIAFDTDNGDESAPQAEDKKFRATDPGGSTGNEDYNGTGTVWDPSYVSPYTWYADGARDVTDGNYITYEFAIPFKEVWNTTTPGSGQIAGLAVHAHDDDGTGADYYWGSSDLNTPSTFGDLEIPEFQEIVIVLVVVPLVIVAVRRRSDVLHKD